MSEWSFFFKKAKLVQQKYIAILHTNFTEILRSCDEIMISSYLKTLKKIVDQSCFSEIMIC